jgi:hypothetical protein
MTEQQRKLYEALIADGLDRAAEAIARRTNHDNIESIEFFASGLAERGLPSTLSQAFVWAHSPEGHDFWYDIYKRLYHM